MDKSHPVSPKVCVCVVTYNQRDYIGHCLQSLLDQETGFPFEIIVGDDCSTDGTSDIVAEFARRFPTAVHHVKHEKNVGASRNYISVHRLACARAPYVAHVDGDDYALPGKLAAQAALLDSRPDVALSAHAVQVIGEDRAIGAEPALPELGSMEDLLLRGTYFVNSSTMYRSAQTFEHGEHGELLDFYVHIERASRGLIHLNKSVLGAYRWHAGGMSKDARQRKRIQNGYERAFDRALELGVDPSLVEHARMQRRMRFAISLCLAREDAEYRRAVRIPAERWAQASTKHRILHYGRSLPFLVRAYSRLMGITG